MRDMEDCEAWLGAPWTHRTLEMLMAMSLSQFCLEEELQEEWKSGSSKSFRAAFWEPKAVEERHRVIWGGAPRAKREMIREEVFSPLLFSEGDKVDPNAIARLGGWLKRTIVTRDLPAIDALREAVKALTDEGEDSATAFPLLQPGKKKLTVKQHILLQFSQEVCTTKTLPTKKRLREACGVFEAETSVYRRALKSMGIVLSEAVRQGG